MQEALGTDLLPSHLSVSRLVCPEGVLWQNGRLNLDAIWGGELGQSRDEYIRWKSIDGGPHSPREGEVWGVFDVNLLVSMGFAIAYSVRVRKFDKISIRPIYHWRRLFAGFLKM